MGLHGQAPLSKQTATKIIDSVAAMIKAGHASQIVLSHGMCIPAQLKIHGGGGYTCINDVILPGLKANGIHQRRHDPRDHVRKSETRADVRRTPTRSTPESAP